MPRAVPVRRPVQHRGPSRAVEGGPAFSCGAPRPTAPDLHDETDEALGEIETDVQPAVLRVFVRKAKGVEPLHRRRWTRRSATRADFRAACALPASQGTDGWVTALPEELAMASTRSRSWASGSTFGLQRPLTLSAVGGRCRAGARPG